MLYGGDMDDIAIVIAEYGHFIYCLFFSADNLIRVNPKPGGNLIQGFLPFDRFCRDFGLEIRGMTNSLASQ